MRRTRSFIAAAAGLALAASAFTGVAGAQATTRSAPASVTTAAVGTKPLAAVVAPYAASWNNNGHDYNIVTHAVFAVLKAHPKSKVAVLANGNVALTAFLPNDRAFQILVKQLTGKTLMHESDVFTAVASLGIPTVEKVLLYHVVPGATITSAMALKSNGANLVTALGVKIHVAVYGGPEISLWDKAYSLRNPRVILSQVDINKGNKQIAHGIDRVLLPFQP